MAVTFSCPIDQFKAGGAGHFQLDEKTFSPGKPNENVYVSERQRYGFIQPESSHHIL